MGNVFKSMALAVALAAWGTNVKAEGWLDTRVMKTKGALAELLGSLDPDTYGKAMEVLQWDLWLLTDGRLDPTDEPTIIDHMGKLAKLFPEETDKVLKAMNGIETTVVAVNQNGEQLVPLGEKAKENLAENVRIRKWLVENASFTSNVQATLDQSKEGDISIKTIGKGYYAIVVPIKWKQILQMWNKIVASFKVISEETNESAKIQIIPKVRWQDRPSLWFTKDDNGIVWWTYTVAEEGLNELQIRIHNGTSPQGGENTIVIRDISVMVE